MLMELLGDALPQIMEFPSSYYEAKKMISALGLGYQKIDAALMIAFYIGVSYQKKIVAMFVVFQDGRQ